jgi:steroid 5-alpha reductase family enzyme
LLMWLFLYYITGIPFSEQQALRHRGQNYQDYQQRTSMFIPRQPKE